MVGYKTIGSTNKISIATPLDWPGCRMRGVEVLAIAWIVGLVIYFSLTTERQRENNLLVMWVLLLLPVVCYPIMRLLFP